jgi:hypothetical protein
MFSGLRSLFHRDEIQPAVCRSAVDLARTPTHETDRQPITSQPKARRKPRVSKTVVKHQPADIRLVPYTKDWTPEQVARAFLKWLQAPELELNGLIRADLMKRLYDEFCLDVGIRRRPWNPVAKIFDDLTTGGQKPYANFYIQDRAKWLRFYPIPGRPETGWEAVDSEPERRVA